MSDTAGHPIRIATRNSRLALWQANHIAQLLRGISADLEIELVHVSTVGDRNQTGSLAQLGGFGVFTREVQRAVLDGRADIAVHSLKDLPTESVDGLTLAAVPRRGPTCDALVLPLPNLGATTCQTNPADTSPLLNDVKVLPVNARIGTGSLRRRAQLLHLRQDLQPLDVRGNVETRLKKLDEGQCDALVLAEAGLRRLALADRVSVRLQAPSMFPAVGQGAIGVECRQDDQCIQLALSPINDRETLNAVIAERSLLASLRAGCHAPLGACTHYANHQLSLEAVVLSHDGQTRLLATATGEPEQANDLGRQAAAQLQDQGADALISEGRTIRET